MSTAIIYSDDYLKHDTGHHPERRERYRAVLNGLMADEDRWQSFVKLSPRAATDEELERCHTARSIARVHQACEQAMMFEHVQIDADTVVSEHSDVAARLAAGGACRAVDAVVSGEAENVFVACRPPGHHATVGQAMGFCLYNNTAVAARYAQTVYPEQIKQVLIVDFDVHHGNGTQDIFYDDPSVFYYSLHQYPWYPGTGMAEERGVGLAAPQHVAVQVLDLAPLAACQVLRGGRALLRHRAGQAAAAAWPARRAGLSTVS